MLINGREIDGRVLSPYQMTDIHMHIIPAVDDGAWDMEMSGSMLRTAIMQGIRTIIATPHSSALDWDRENTLENFKELVTLAESAYPEVEILLGCEIACNRSTIENIKGKLASGFYPTMNQKRYVLTEFSTSAEVKDIQYCLEALLDSGWTPILAHAERYRKLFQKEATKDTIETLKEKGCLIQMNVYSIVQEEEEQIRENAARMLELKQVDFLGSDAHRTHYRPPEVEVGLQYLYENYEKEYVDDIVFQNADRLMR